MPRGQQTHGETKMFEVVVPFLIGTALGIDPTPMRAPTDEVAWAPTESEQTAPRLGQNRSFDPLFTTAEDVKPILELTQRNWIAVRSDATQDYLYFTHLLSWRCGLTSVSFGVNGAAPSQPVQMEPCYTGTSAPNALMVSDGYAPYVAFDANSLETVTVAVVYDDGTSNLLSFNRQDVLLR